MRTLFAVLWLGSVLGVNGEVIFFDKSTWSYLKGVSQASSPDPTTWREIGFDDSGWLVGLSPFYYENSPGSATEYSGNTLLDDMFGGYTCIFMRQKFVLTNLA